MPDIRHGYRLVDDVEILANARHPYSVDLRSPSTHVLSVWELAPDHRIAQMARADLPMTLATNQRARLQADADGAILALTAPLKVPAQSC